MKKKVLLAGESWFSHTIHTKGFDSFTTSVYEEGAGHLLAALEQAGYETDYQPSHVAALRFPFSARELADYACVILSDIGSNTLLLHPDTFARSKALPDRSRVILNYVREGGALLMIGGYMSFSGIGAKAKWGKTALKDALAVECLNGDDLVECPEGAQPEPVAGHPALRGVPEPWPRFLGYNRARLLPDTQVAASVGGDPFLAFRQVGRGRSGAFLSDCAPHWGPPEFLAWEGYPLLWASVLSYLCGG